MLTRLHREDKADFAANSPQTAANGRPPPDAPGQQGKSNPHRLHRTRGIPAGLVLQAPGPGGRKRAALQTAAIRTLNCGYAFGG